MCVSRPSGTDPLGAGRIEGSPAAGLRLSVAAFAALRSGLGEALGLPAADDVLYRVGRRWGEAAARDLGPCDAAEVLTRGLERWNAVGLVTVSVEHLELDPARGDVVLRGRIGPPPASEADLSPDCGCALAVGFSTGLLAAATGLDLGCDPLRCPQACGPDGGTFEVRPTHRRARGDAAAPLPAGSARFVLGELGSGLGDRDISLDDLMQNTTDAILLIDDVGHIRYWNAGAEAMFQYTRAEAIGAWKDLLVPEDLRDELDQVARRLARDGTVSNFVTRRVRKDGRMRWVSLTVSVLHDSDGRSVGTTAVMRDVTEQKLKDDELARSQGLAMIGELAAKVAHEIKNPLTGIYAAVQALARDLEPDDARREVYDDVGAEIRRLDETVQDLLRFARPVTPTPRPVGLRSFLKDIVESLRRQPDVARHDVRVDIDEDLVVPIDSSLAMPVFTNLVLNAAQSMVEPGSVTMTADVVDGDVVVDVSDTGPGVPPDVAANVFDPFFTTKSRGTGLGLPIARRNVECHGGSLELADAPSGARFRVRLPARREA